MAHLFSLITTQETPPYTLILHRTATPTSGDQTHIQTPTLLQHQTKQHQVPLHNNLNLLTLHVYLQSHVWADLIDRALSRHWRQSVWSKNFKYQTRWDNNEQVKRLSIF